MNDYNKLVQAVIDFSKKDRMKPFVDGIHSKHCIILKMRHPYFPCTEIVQEKIFEIVTCWG